MTEKNQDQAETTIVTKVVDENGKGVDIEGDNFTLYEHKPLVVSAWKLPYMVQVTTPEREMIGDIGDWLVVGIEGVFICKSGVFDLRYSPVTNPPETESGMASTETTDPPILQWRVSLRCEVGLKPDVLMPAWKTRLPNVPINIDFQASTEYISVFDVVVGVEASSDSGACSMAKGLLRRHFDTIEVLKTEADQV